MSRLIHFEILATDPVRASKFYQQIFGWKVDSTVDEDYLLLTTGSSELPGINGGIMPRMEPFSATTGYQAFVCTIEVDDLDATVAKIQDMGGRQLTEKKEIPQIGLHCYCEDTEGNAFGILMPPVPKPSP